MVDADNLGPSLASNCSGIAEEFVDRAEDGDVGGKRRSR